MLLSKLHFIQSFAAKKLEATEKEKENMYMSASVYVCFFLSRHMCVWMCWTVIREREDVFLEDVAVFREVFWCQ